MKYQGLTEQEVGVSREKHGTNALGGKRGRSFLARFLAGLGDPIIRILLCALALNVLLLFRDGSLFEALGIAIAVLVSTLVSTLSEYTSDRAFARMQAEAEQTTARVWRSGRLMPVPTAELVVGDLVALSAGERIPADGILRDGTLSVDQSALNGETVETEKRRTPASDRWELTNAGQVFRGSLITAGEATMEVCRVGTATVYGGMAQSLGDTEREGPLRVKLRGLATLLSRIGYLAAVLVVLADLSGVLFETGFAQMTAPALAAHLLHAATLGITVVVVCVPEGLPMMITVVLSANMKRMQKNGVMVRKLTGIETAGSLNLLFCDKTGTLTCGKQTPVLLYADGARYQTVGKVPEALRRELLYCGLGGGESVVCDGVAVGGNSTDRALTGAWHRQAVRLSLTWETVHRVPFDSTRKTAACTVFAEGTRRTYHKGAPERLLPHCRFRLTADGTRLPLDSEAVETVVCELTRNAMRTLVLCREDADGMVFLGLVALRDPLRKETRGAIAALHSAGIGVVMITGDHKETAAAIARECGILSEEVEGSVLTGSALAAMTDEAVKALLPRLRVVARALPADKLRLVRLAEELGLVVGMTGDGMNDAPALRHADVGFAMGSGTEVAKEAGDIVILDDNIASIVRAVLYGRTVFLSIRKFLVFQLTMNLCAVGVSVIAPFFGIDAPVTVLQMLWVNMIMDTLAGLAFAGEWADPAYLRHPPKRREEPVLTGEMGIRILLLGGFSVALSMLVLLHPWFDRFFLNEAHKLTAFFCLFILCGVWNGFHARGERGLFTGLLRNPAFVPILLLVVEVQVALVYCGGALFRCVPLAATEWRVTVLASLVCLAWGTCVKWFCTFFVKKSAKKAG